MSQAEFVLIDLHRNKTPSLLNYYHYFYCTIFHFKIADSALITACKFGQKDVILYLMEIKADVDVAGKVSGIFLLYW